MPKGVYTRPSPTGRFWAKVDKNGPVVRPELGSCWVWTAALLQDGYGAFRLNDRQRRAHTVSYEWFVGPIPEGLLVLHRCDVRRCVRPSHLHTNTQKINIEEAVARGRMSTGLRNGMHRQNLTKLSEAEVREIYALGLQDVVQHEIARRYGVDRKLVSDILNGKKWRHLGLMPIRRRPGPRGKAHQDIP